MVSIARAVDIMRSGEPMPEVRDNGEDLHWYYHQYYFVKKLRELTPRALHVEIEVLYHLDYDERRHINGYWKAFQVLCLMSDDFDKFSNTLFPELMPVYCAALREKKAAVLALDSLAKIRRQYRLRHFATVGRSGFAELAK